MGKEKIISPATHVVILGAGDILDYAAVKRLLSPQDFVICADGGYSHCARLDIAPDLLIGDFDSIIDIPPDQIPRHTLEVGKNYTDTFCAIEYAIAREYKKFLLIGMLGGRLDHTLANLQSLGFLATQGVDAQIFDGVTTIYSVYAPQDQMVTFTIPHQPGCYFSLLALCDRCQSVTILNAEYPLDQYPLGNCDPRAVSNEFLLKDVQILLQGGILLVTVTPHDIVI